MSTGAQAAKTTTAGQRVRPLLDGDRYLGFIFVEAATRHEVEQALTATRWASRSGSSPGAGHRRSRRPV